MFNQRSTERIIRSVQRSEDTHPMAGVTGYPRSGLVPAVTVLVRVSATTSTAGVFYGEIWQRDPDSTVGAFIAIPDVETCLVYGDGLTPGPRLYVGRVVYYDETADKLEVLVSDGSQGVVYAKLTARASATGKTTRYAFTEWEPDGAGSSAAVSGGLSSSIAITGDVLPYFAVDVSGTVATDDILNHYAILKPTRGNPQKYVMGPWRQQSFTVDDVTGVTTTAVCRNDGSHIIDVSTTLVTAPRTVSHWYIG